MDPGMAAQPEPPPFTGFPRAAFDWFAGLEADNSKAYFERNRALWEREVRDQLEALLEELADDFGGRVKMFRPNRDIRFSADKSPYKTATYGLIFGRPASHAGLYAQLTSAGLFAGSGYHTFARDQLERYREKAAGRAGANLATMLAELGGEGFQLIGDELKTVPRGYDRDHRNAAVLRRKAVAAGRRIAPNGRGGIGRERALEHVAGTWKRLGPMNRWLDRNVGPSDEPPEQRFRR
jgi:uncharacterized protein (TIGR02453 family)